MSTQTQSKPDTAYNGWKNYETWNVALWIDNDEGTQRQWNERARVIAADPDDRHGFIARGVFTRAECAATELARELQSDFEENAPDLRASVWTDLLNADRSQAVPAGAQRIGGPGREGAG